MPPISIRRALLPLTLVALAASGCGGDPVEELQARRARYEAELTGFVVRDEPAAARPDILLDVLVRGTAEPPLERLTLDISMAGADGAERMHRRVAVDVHGVGPGGSQMAVTLEEVDYRPGDGFWVEVRVPIPAADRAEYVEFEGVG